MRIFLDTNVLASAVATRGLCADVLREVLTRHDLIISNALLKELKRVLQNKFKVPSPLISGFIAMLQQDSLLAVPIDSPVIQIKDRDDIIILAAALGGEAELFITGDKELLELGKVGKLTIISPRAFWDRLTA
jgi:putative PIN family toxin of toxin-antitoxin system